MSNSCSIFFSYRTSSPLSVNENGEQGTVVGKYASMGSPAFRRRCESFSFSSSFFFSSISSLLCCCCLLVVVIIIIMM